ncbi:MAG: hypothetical protein DBX08_03190 [Nitrosopumilus sp.]|nr:MAG: hypothetical protein DBX08_03190 [Nitrosopumilus sp.]
MKFFFLLNTKNRESISEDEVYPQRFRGVQDCIEEIVSLSKIRLGFHRRVEPTVRQTNQTVSSSGIFSKNLISFR